MKVKDLLLCTLVAALMVGLGVSGAYGAVGRGGVYAGTIETNRATLSGVNFTDVPTEVNFTVATQYGGIWTGEASLPGQVAGSYVTNTTYLTNCGNISDTFDFSSISNANSGATAHPPWTYSFNPASVTIAADSTPVTNINFVVYISNAAENGTWEEWVLEASSQGDAAAVSYDGDNGVHYGGTIGEDALAGNGDIVITVGARTWRVTVSGPVMSIAKTIASIELTAVASAPVPGATVTFNLFVTNSGTADADTPVVTDTVNTTDLAYVIGSISNTNINALTNKTWASPTLTWTGDIFPANSQDLLAFQVIIK